MIICRRLHVKTFYIKIAFDFRNDRIEICVWICQISTRFQSLKFQIVKFEWFQFDETIIVFWLFMNNQKFKIIKFWMILIWRNNQFCLIAYMRSQILKSKLNDCFVQRFTSQMICQNNVYKYVKLKLSNKWFQINR